MIKCKPEQLIEQLNTSLYQCYFLLGRDEFLLQESLNNIRSKTKLLGFNEHLNITIENNTDWDIFFHLCQERSLFSIRQTILVTLTEHYQLTLDSKLSKVKLSLHNDLIIILLIRDVKITYNLKNNIWFKVLTQHALLVNCTESKQISIQYWIDVKIKDMKLKIDDETYQLLCCYYEGNLFALNQILIKLSLLYLDGNLSSTRVKALISDHACFTSLHWIHATLEGNNKRAIHVLHRLKANGIEPVVLLRSIQREILLLIIMKQQELDVPISELLDQHKIVKNKRTIISHALQRLSLIQLKIVINFMTKIELNIKQQYNYNIWYELYYLTTIICNTTILSSIIIGL